MSTTASIDIYFYQQVSPVDIIDALLSYGWTLSDNGHISYLPLGNSEFDWQWCSLSESPKILDLIGKKSFLNETIGISLMWEDTNIGGELLIWGEGETSFCLNLTSNRQIVGGSDYTDYLWYLTKIVEALISRKFYPIKVLCDQS